MGDFLGANGSGGWSQAGQGAMGGASVGSSFGPYGALIGGAFGGAMGYLGNGDDISGGDLKTLAQGYGNRTAPQGQSANQAQYSQFRSNQAGLIAQLEAMARGEGPSAAQQQMRESMDRAAGAQASAAAGAGGRGVNAGGAMRTAMNNTAAIQSQGARDMGILRSNEQMNAIGQLGAVTAQARSADEGVNMFNAGQSNQLDQANLEAKLRMLGINDQSQLNAIMMALKLQGPGMGTQIMAGGAQAAPAFAQMMASQNAQQAAAQHAADQQAAAETAQYHTDNPWTDSSNFWGDIPKE